MYIYYLKMILKLLSIKICKFNLVFCMTLFVKRPWNYIKCYISQ